MTWNRLDDEYHERFERDHPEAQDRAYLHTFTAGVFLPGLQALFTALAFGLCAGIMAVVFAWGKPWAWTLGAFALVLALSWLALLWRWLDLTRPLERLTGLDLNRDGLIGGDPLPPPNVRIELVSPDRKHTTIAELPTSQEKLIRLAAGLLSGASFSEGQWTGTNAPFSRSEFRALRQELLARGLLAPASDKDIRQGYALTPGGLAAMRYFASLAGGSSPTLPDGNHTT